MLYAVSALLCQVYVLLNSTFQFNHSIILSTDSEAPHIIFSSPLLLCLLKVPIFIITITINIINIIILTTTTMNSVVLGH